MFLATPFCGSDAAKQAQWLVVVGGIMGEQTSDKLVQDLNKNNDVLDQRTHEFAEIANSSSLRLPIHCFYETKKTEILRRILSPSWATRISTRNTHKIVGGFLFYTSKPLT